MKRHHVLALSALSTLSMLSVVGCAALFASSEPTFDTHRFERAGPAGAPTVLVVLTPSEATQEVLGSLSDELSGDFGIVTLPVVDGVGVEDLRSRIDEVHPSCVVLMNNTTVRLYRAYQRALTPSAIAPPAVVVMASYLEELRIGMANTTGISYEVPAVTIFRSLRSMLDRPVRRVGVVYRQPFSRFIARQREMADEENIEFVGVRISNDPSPWELQDALVQLRDEQHVDALWVLNDNRLLGTPEMYADGWEIMLEDDPLPIIVGVGSLVRSDRTFGSFAMVPDHVALGVQTANLIFTLADDGWQIAKDTAVQPPLSVKTIVDLPFARRYLSFKEEMLSRIDRVVE